MYKVQLGADIPTENRFKETKTGCGKRSMEYPTESIKELIKLSLMICRHLVWELFDRKKKHRGQCQINGLNPQCLWVNSGDERTRNFIYSLNTIRY